MQRRQQQQNNHLGPNATGFIHAEWIHTSSGNTPPTRGENYLIKSFLFNPYPTIPPYYVKTLHPGTRTTKNKYKDTLTLLDAHKARDIHTRSAARKMYMSDTQQARARRDCKYLLDAYLFVTCVRIHSIHLLQLTDLQPDVSQKHLSLIDTSTAHRHFN